MKLWLVRHAPVLLAPGVCYGASDVPADEAASQATAERLALILPQRLSVSVSCLGRAQMMASQLLALRPDLCTPRIDPRLNEVNFGKWELTPWSHIPREAFDAWMSDFAHHRFGGEESTQMVINRVAAAMRDIGIAAGSSSRERPEQDAVWITHAGVIRAVQFVALHGREEIRSVGEWPETAPLPGEWTALSWPP